MGNGDKQCGRTRKSNWTKDEINVLIAEVESGKYMLHGKQHTDGVRITPQDRFRAWAMVAHKVNSRAVGPCKRTVSEVKKKWQDMKFMAKRKEEGFQRRELKQMDSVAATMSDSSGGNSVDQRETDCINNMSLYLDCMETFQEALSDHDDEVEVESETRMPSSSKMAPSGDLDWEDQTKLLHPVDWDMAPGSSKRRFDFAEQLLVIEREKLKVKKEKLRVLKDMFRIQKERLAFEKKRQKVVFVKQLESSVQEAESGTFSAEQLAPQMSGEESVEDKS